MRLNLGPVDLCQVVKNAIDVVRPAADAKRISLGSTIETDSACVTADPDRLQQVLWNLLSNAVKFTQAGGHVAVRLRRSESQLEVVIHDDGIGIGPTLLPWIFDRFRQGDSSSSRQQAGLGLGLAITRHLVELHGGTVQAHSDGEGLGATFTIRLPVRAVAADSGGATSGARGGEPTCSRAGADSPQDWESALRGLSVLVVDDEADARELIRTVLEQHGAEVAVAGSAAEALAALAERPPDVLLADIGMPVTDGYELIRRVRTDGNPALARLPAIACTAYGRDEDRLRALQAGYQQHLAKPVLPDELVAVVAAVSGLVPS